MRCTLLFTLLTASVLGCADANPTDDAVPSPVLAAQNPWLDDGPAETKPSVDDVTSARPDAGQEPREGRDDPWLDPPLTPSNTESDGYDFETGREGWARSGSPIAFVSTSSEQHVSGRRSLAVDVDGSGKAQVVVANPPLQAGATVTFHVYVPAGAKLSFVQPYVQEDESADWRWTGNWQALSALRTGAWNTLKVTAPARARPFAWLGVEIATAGFWRGRIYVDAVSF